MEKEITVCSVKECYELGNNVSSKVLAFAFGLSAEIERDLISMRTKEALAQKKKQGAILGRPKGSLSKEVYLEKYKDEIQLLVEKKVSYRSISRIYNCHYNTVSYFVKTRLK